MGQIPFQRLQEELTNMIVALPAESQLPSEPKLAKQMGVSRATLREAMRSFETQGLIRRKQGVGTFVIGEVPIIDAGLEVLESIETLAGRLGMSVTTHDLEIDPITASEELAKLMGLQLETILTRVSRVILTDGRPVAYLEDVIPASIISPFDLAKNFSGSVLDHLQRRGLLHLATSRTEIKAVTAPRETALKLQIQRGDVLLNFTADLYTATGQLIDHSFSYFLPGYFKFHVNRRVG